MINISKTTLSFRQVCLDGLSVVRVLFFINLFILMNLNRVYASGSSINCFVPKNNINNLPGCENLTETSNVKDINNEEQMKKCFEVNRNANDCPMRVYISPLEIDEKLKFDLKTSNEKTLCNRSDLLAAYGKKNNDEKINFDITTIAEKVKIGKYILNCNVGHKGSINMHCRKKNNRIGEWEYESGKCEILTCNKENPLANYNVEGATGSINYNEEHTFNCMTGYTGNVKMKCNKDGEWIHSDGACNISTCNTANALNPNTYHILPANKNVKHGETFNFTCEVGYSGTVALTCNNGNWISPTGTCIISQYSKVILTDGSIIQNNGESNDFKLDNFCNMNTSDTATLSIKGKTIAKNKIKILELGKDITNSGVTSLCNDFMSHATNFNSPLKLPDSITSIGILVMYNATSFNSPIIFPSKLKYIDDGFMRGVSSFNQPLNLPNTLTTIKVDFLRDADNFTSTINIGTLSATVFSTSNYTLGTGSSSAKLYTVGATITGTNAAAFRSRFPNRTSSPYRKLK